MVRLTLNVDEEVFAGSKFELVPTGRKRVTIYEITQGEVKAGPNAGKPRLNFQFKIAEGEPNAGRYLFANINAFETPNQKDPSKMNPMYDLIGIGGAIGLSAEQVRNFDSDEWLGEELFLTVVHKEKKTKESNYTESFDPPEFEEAVKGFRSTKSVTTSVGAAEAVNTGTTAKAASGAKAGAKPKFTL